MAAHSMIGVILVLLVTTLKSRQAQGTSDAKKIEHLEKQVEILSNLVQAQSNIMAILSCQGPSGSGQSLTSACILKIADQAKKIGKLQGELGALDTLSKTQDSQIKQLQSSVKDLLKNITAQETKLTSAESKCASEVSSLRSEIKKGVQTSSTLTNKVTQLGSKVQQLSGAWPSGKYCILASGSCPSGFSRSSAFMRAISLYAGNGHYISQGTFGDSKIKCHGRCGQYGNWIGELYITACCK